MWKLIFGPSVFKKGRGNTNFWFRQNGFGCLFMFLLFPMIYGLIGGGLQLVHLINKADIDKNAGYLVLFYIPLMIVTYKMIVTAVRHNKKSYPVWNSNKNNLPANTPFHAVNVAAFFINFIPVDQVIGYQTMTPDQILLNRKQQEAKLKYHAILFTLTLIVMTSMLTDNLLLLTLISNPPKLINVVGLILDITGAVMIYLNTPHPSNQTWIYSSEEGKALYQQEKKERRRVKLGMILLGSGFLLQLISTIIG